MAQRRNHSLDPSLDFYTHRISTAIDLGVRSVEAPLIAAPAYSIEAVGGKVLRDPMLNEIARVFISLDVISLRLSKSSQSLRAQYMPAGESDPTMGAWLDVDFESTIQSLERVKDGLSEIHEDYLRDTRLAQFWNFWSQLKPLRSQIWKNPSNSENAAKKDMYYEYLKTTEIYANRLKPIPELLVAAKAEGLLPDGIPKGIEERLVKYGYLLDFVRDNLAGPAQDDLTWVTLSRRVKRTKVLPRVDTESAIVPVDIQSSQTKQWNPTLFALTTLSTISTCIFAIKAWQYSDPEKGTAKEADFWWILQGSTMQLLGLFALSMVISQSPQLSRQDRFWTWSFFWLALLSAIAAPILYVTMPVGSASTSASIAGLMQAFVPLQIAFASGEKQEKEHQS